MRVVGKLRVLVLVVCLGCGEAVFRMVEPKPQLAEVPVSEQVTQPRPPRAAKGRTEIEGATGPTETLWGSPLLDAPDGDFAELAGSRREGADSATEEKGGPSGPDKVAEGVKPPASEKLPTTPAPKPSTASAPKTSTASAPKPAKAPPTKATATPSSKAPATPASKTPTTPPPKSSAASAPAAKSRVPRDKAAVTTAAPPEKGATTSESELPITEEKEGTKTIPRNAGQGEVVLWDDFEASHQWIVESASGPARVGLSTTRPSHGEKALRAEFSATERRRFEVRREVRMDLALMDSIVLDVYSEAKEPMGLSLALRAGPGPKLYEAPFVEIKPGWNKDVVFDLRSETFKVDGLGDFDGLFDGRDDVRRISLIFDEKDNLKGVVHIDNIRFTGRIINGWQQFRPRITGIIPRAEVVKLYETVEIGVQFEASYESYFDSEDMSVTSVFAGPAGKKLTVRGFFNGFRKDENGEEESAWLIRFAPTAIGRWEYQITVKNKMGEDVSQACRLECTEKGNSRGFVRRSAKDAGYFELDNGQFFYPMGQNVAWSADYEYYFKKMREYGENYARVWMCPWNLMLERTPYVGEYDLDVARKIDDILALAEKYDVYVQLVLDYHGMLRDDSWKDNPYNSDNGGPCLSEMDFFVNGDAKKLYKRRLEYIAARWGASTRIFAWELFNEADLTKYYDEDDVVTWHTQMMAHLAKSDPYKHLITTSSFGAALTKKLAAISSLNIVQKHIYSTNVVKSIRESWQENYGFRKPYFVSELGADVQPETDVQDVGGETLHAGLWAAFMTPSAGNAMPWWWDTAVDASDLYAHWGALAAFARGEDRRGKNYKMVHVTIPLSGGEKLEAQGLLCRTELLLWIYDPTKIQDFGTPQYTRIPGGTYLWLVGMAEGEYDIEFWDVYDGRVIQGLAKRSDLGRLKIVFPEATKDIACKVKFRGTLVEPALRLQLDEKQDEVRGEDARIPR